MVQVSDDDDDGSDADGDDVTHETTQERNGLAKSGPVRVLEVGCGDMPLGKELAAELVELEHKTKGKATAIVEKIVCCDYSSEVIDLLKVSMPTGTTEHDKPSDNTIHENDNEAKDEGSKKVEAESNVDGTDSNPVKTIPPTDGSITSRVTTIADILEYVTADARSMTYDDGSFHLILEKGTLDAMLSDKEEGVSNCVAIVKECARVLATGGESVPDLDHSSSSSPCWCVTSRQTH